MGITELMVSILVPLLLIAASIVYFWRRHIANDRIEIQKAEIVGMIEDALHEPRDEKIKQRERMVEVKRRRKGLPVAMYFVSALVLAALSIGGWTGAVGHFPPWAPSTIYVIYVTPTPRPTLTPTPTPRTTATPTSIDGQRIAFGSPSVTYPNFYNIWVMNADGSSRKQLSTGSPNVDPSWSPDGTHIAFTSYRDENNEIYVMNADGSNQTQLTNTSYNSNLDPNWSPDGNKIAFDSNRDGKYQIYVMNADGSNQIRLINNTATDINPAWSPGGNKITFDSNRDGNPQIYVMNADGSNQIRLTNNTATDQDPAWSPDGNKIAFDSNRDGIYQIYVMNADGSSQIRLGSGTMQYVLPDDKRPCWWSPPT